MHRKLCRKRVNVFLVNLAIGDLLVCFVTMTTEILFVAFGEWVMGAVVCKLVVYAQIVTMASATFLLTAMSIDRYQVLVKPLQALAGPPKIWRKVTIAWIMAFIFATPQLLIFVQTDEGVRPDGTVKHLCRSKGYTAMWQRKVYFSFLTTYILVIPTIIMSFCYINIIGVVWMRTDSKHRKRPKFRIRFATNCRLLPSRNCSNDNEHELTTINTYSSESDGSERLMSRRDAMASQNQLSIPKKLVSSSKRNVVKMTLSVIMGFVLCWTPYFVLGLLRIFSGYKIQLPHTFAVAEIMAMVHSAMNPILYGIFSTKAAKKVCAGMCRKLKRHDVTVAAKYETTALSDDDTTWAETKFTRIHHGPDLVNTNCNCLNSSRSKHVFRLINLIKLKCSKKTLSHPVTRVVSRYYEPHAGSNGVIRNKTTYVELAERSRWPSPSRQNVVIANHHAPFSAKRNVITRHNAECNSVIMRLNKTPSGHTRSGTHCNHTREALQLPEASTSRSHTSSELSHDGSIQSRDHSSIVQCDQSSVQASDRNSIQSRDCNNTLSNEHSSTLSRDYSSIPSRDCHSKSVHDHNSKTSHDLSSILSRDNSSLSCHQLREHSDNCEDHIFANNMTLEPNCCGNSIRKQDIELIANVTSNETLSELETEFTPSQNEHLCQKQK